MLSCNLSFALIDTCLSFLMQRFLYAAARTELIVLVSNQLHIRWSEGMCHTFFLHCYDNISWTFRNKISIIPPYLHFYKRINIAMEVIEHFGSDGFCESWVLFDIDDVFYFRNLSEIEWNKLFCIPINNCKIHSLLLKEKGSIHKRKEL